MLVAGASAGEPAGRLGGSRALRLGMVEIGVVLYYYGAFISGAGGRARQSEPRSSMTLDDKIARVRDFTSQVLAVQDRVGSLLTRAERQPDRDQAEVNRLQAELGKIDLILKKPVSWPTVSRQRARAATATLTVRQGREAPCGRCGSCTATTPAASRHRPTFAVRADAASPVALATGADGDCQAVIPYGWLVWPASFCTDCILPQGQGLERGQVQADEARSCAAIVRALWADRYTKSP